MYNIKVDIYSLGVIFYQMLFGNFPYQPRTERELIDMIKGKNPKFNLNNVKIS